MSQASFNAYLRTQVMTAGPLQLRLLLYDGALRFCRNARKALESSDFEQNYYNLNKAQNIVIELSNSLQYDQAPELCDRLAALYNYCYRRLVDANLERDPEIIDEVIELISYERETWRLLMEQTAGGDGEAHGDGAPPDSAPGPGAHTPAAGRTLSRSA